MRYVYDFDEETTGGRELLGGKGAGLAEMTSLGVPAPGFTITTEACNAYKAAGDKFPEGTRGRGRGALAALEGRHRQAVRRGREPAPRLGPLGRQVLDAGDDGHGAQPRPQRGDPRRPRRPHRQRALRLRRLPPLHPALRQDRARDQRREVRAPLSEKKQARRTEDTRSRPRSCASCPRFKQIVRQETGRDFPTDPLQQLESPSAPSSPRGTASAPRITAGPTRSRTTSARPSTS